MTRNAYVYILLMFAATYAVRVLPLTLVRREIKNVYIRSFLYYVPYVTLSVMTFPAIMDATGNPLSGLLALAAGLFLAWKGAGLMKVAIACCAVVFVLEMII